MTSLSNMYGITKIKSFLPLKIIDGLDKLSLEEKNKLNEIRIKSDRPTTVTLNGKSFFLSKNGISSDLTITIKVTQQEINSFLYDFCQGSVYSYGNSIQEGFVTRFGVRVGLSGNLCVENGKVKGFSVIDSLNIRIPSHIDNCSDTLMKYIGSNDFPDNKGFLIISKPGVGKTTILRDLALRLSKPCTVMNSKKLFRVCVIDERNEFRIGQVFDESSADFLCGANKDYCINLATRVLSPDIIICDEIGGEKEAYEILKSVFSGIVFIASAHASSTQEALSKKHLKTLIDSSVFGGICTLSRQGENVYSKLEILQGT